MNAARVLVTAELLRQALALPANATVIGCRPADRLGDIELKIISDDLPDVPEGAVIPLCDPVLRTEYRDCGHHETTWTWLDQGSDGGASDF